MVVQRNFYYNGALGEPPENAEQLKIKLSFDKDLAEPVAQVSITDFKLAVDNAAMARKWVADGNAFIGMPFLYELERDGVKEPIFPGYLDFSDSAQLDDFQSVTIKAKLREQIDWFNDKVDSLCLDDLFTQDPLTDSEKIWMPYVISTIPNYTEALITLVTTASISFQILEQTEQLIELLSGTANPLEFSTVVRAIFRVLFIIGLIITLVLLLRQLAQLIIQPVKYHACMRARTILERICTHFGYTLDAPVFQSGDYKDLVILPEKYFNPPTADDIPILGFTQPSISQTPYQPLQTPGDFIREMKTLTKSRVLILNDKTLKFLPEYQQTGLAQYQLPDIFEPEYELNTSELFSNFEIEFLTDINDRNTLQNYLGTTYQVTTSQNPPLQDNFLNVTKNNQTVQIPYARASAKKDLTLPETIMQVFLDDFGPIMNGLINVANAIGSVINDFVDLANDLIDIIDDVGGDIDNIDADPVKRIDPVDTSDIIQNRIDMMLLANDFVSVKKMFIISQGSEPKYNKIALNNSTLVSAKYVWEASYGPSVSFVPSAGRPTANQFIIRKFKQTPFTFSDFLLIKANNEIFTADGNPAQIIDGEWDDWNERIDLSAKIPFLYTTKLIESYTEPDGK